MSKTSRRFDQLSKNVIIAGFEGPDLPADLAGDLCAGTLGGLILFRRNIESLPQVSALLEEAHGISPTGRTPLIGVDQEGGRVVRLREPLTVLPPARRLGAMDDEGLTRRAGTLVGRELRALGFTIDFAPVLDVDTHEDSPIIGDRAFGSTPETVVKHALAFAEGLKQGGVSPCAKHFPGHGDASLDSHLDLPRVAHDTLRLRSLEMVPFAAWAAAGMGPVMTAHVVYPTLDPELPATLSRPVVSGELRERLGFRGAVLTDDLEMGAITALGGPGKVAVRAVEAGVDGLLVCRRRSHREAVVEALARAASDTPGFAERLEVAAARLASIPLDGFRNAPGWIGSPTHRSLQSEVTGRLTDTE